MTPISLSPFLSPSLFLSTPIFFFFFLETHSGRGRPPRTTLRPNCWFLRERGGSKDPRPRPGPRLPPLSGGGVEILIRGGGLSKYAPGEFGRNGHRISVETVSGKALDSGPGSRRLRTEDSPVSDGGGREGEPELGIWDLTVADCGLCASILWFPAGPFPG